MPLFTMIGAMVLGMFVLPKTANSAAGIGVVFLIHGMLGFAIGPMLNSYLGLSNGPQVVMTALGGTAAIFVGLFLCRQYEERFQFHDRNGFGRAHNRSRVDGG